MNVCMYMCVSVCVCVRVSVFMCKHYKLICRRCFQKCLSTIQLFTRIVYMVRSVYTRGFDAKTYIPSQIIRSGFFLIFFSSVFAH